MAKAKKAAKPPNLRMASDEKNCGHCRHFGLNVCKLYNGYPVRASQTCDSFSPKR